MLRPELIAQKLFVQIETPHAAPHLAPNFAISGFCPNMSRIGSEFSQAAASGMQATQQTCI